MYFSNTWSKYLFFILLILVSIFIRTALVSNWLLYPEDFFSKDEPVLTTADGYYYLSISNDLQNSDFSPRDNLRAYPEGATRPFKLPPLLSGLIFGLSSFTGISFLWISSILPVVLGILIFIPVYLFSRQIFPQNSIYSFFASFFSILTPFYISRSRLSSLDTDCLNVTFALFLSFFAYKAINFNKKTSLVYLSLFLLTVFFYSFWWDQSTSAVFFFVTSSLLLSYLAQVLLNHKSSYLSIIISIIFLVSTLFLLFLRPDLIRSGIGTISYVLKLSESPILNVGLSISEQQPLTFSKFAEYNLAYIPFFIIGIIGFFTLIICQPSIAIFLLPTMIIGSLGYFSAQRFTIFATPGFSIGLAYILYVLYSYSKNKYYNCVLALIIIFCISLKSYTLNSSSTYKPYFTGEVCDGMRSINTSSYRGTVVWSYWDNGHPISFYTEAATVNDGMVHGEELDIFTALPLVVGDFRLSANFMNFYLKNGKEGLLKTINSLGNNFDNGLYNLLLLLKSGPTDGEFVLENLTNIPKSIPTPFNNINYYFPNLPNEIFLFIDQRMIKAIRPLYKIGHWNTSNFSSPPRLPTFRIPRVKPDILEEGSKKQSIYFVENFTKIVASDFFLKPTPINRMIVKDKNLPTISLHRSSLKNVTNNSFTASISLNIAQNPYLTSAGNYDAIYFKEKSELLLIDNRFTNTISYKLFLHTQDSQNKYFELSSDIDTVYQLWRVHPDIARP